MKGLFLLITGMVAGALAYRYWEREGRQRPEIQTLREQGRELAEHGRRFAEQGRELAQQGQQMTQTAMDTAKSAGQRVSENVVQAANTLDTSGNEAMDTMRPVTEDVQD